MTEEPSSGAGRPYAGRSPHARRAERRRRLLDAALELIGGSPGYSATTIAELCRTAGVAPAKFYEEFASREELLLDLCAEILGDALARVREAIVDVEPTIEARSRAGLAAFLHAVLDDPRRARVINLESVGVSPTVEARRRQELDRYADLVIGQVREMVGAPDGGGEEPEALRVLATALIGGVNECIDRWLVLADPPSVDQLVTTLTDLFVVVGEWAASDDRSPL